MTSLSVLHYTLAGSVALLTIFLCLMLYYVIRMLKDTLYTVEKFTVVLKKVDEVADLAREKLKSGGAYIGLAAKAIKSIVEMMGERAIKKAKKASKK